MKKQDLDQSEARSAEPALPDGDLAFLQEVSIFAGLSEAQLRRMRGVMRKEHFAPGSVVVREGDVGNAMYILEEGTVDISKTLMLRVGRHDIGQREKTMARLSGEHHAFFGEMAMLERDGRSATVRAVTPCWLFVIEREDFERVCEEDPRMGYRIVTHISRAVSGRLRSTNQDVLKLTTALSMALRR
ncbi:MAG: cyclic nucleotide-binding domain-containing protein [Candidatus Latescibacterota bacterium]